MRLQTDNIINGPFKQIVVYCMLAKGMDDKKCYRCRIRLNKKIRNIHHTKYNGATIDDLRFCCQSCNKATENKGLT